MKKTTVLCILDGLGINPSSHGNAFKIANTPCLDKLLKDKPNGELITHGELVGLPAGQMGNSEVGHITIGAGRTVDQSLLRIGKAMADDSFRSEPEYQKLYSNTEESNNIHLVGLLGTGGVHSHQDHLYSLIEGLEKDTKANLFLHIITDGRDTGPNDAINEVLKLEDFLNKHPRTKIATISGRFFTMDRDKRWERTEKAYNAICKAKGASAQLASEWIKQSYEENVTDEFIEPAIINEEIPSDSSSYIFWNFRADRMKQLVTALCLDSKEIPFERNFIQNNKNKILCFTNYDEQFGLPVLFHKKEIKNYLGQVVSEAGMTQLRVAETEKYPHVTYFLNGGKEVVLKGEERSLIPSPRDVKTYDLKPEMSAPGITESVISAINSQSMDLIVVNFANCDMVGHTGVLEAGIKAVETADACLAEILSALEKLNGKALIIADHGNAEKMLNEDNSPNTAHTTFPVPVILFGSDLKIKEKGSLKDVAPTILGLLNLNQPKEMTGSSLLS